MVCQPDKQVPELRGREAKKQLLEAHRNAFPDRQFTIDELIAEGDKVAGRWSLAGTHRGEWVGVAPTGKKVSLSGSTTFWITDGMITDEYVQWDALGFLQQVGAAPASTEANKAVTRRYIEEIASQGNLALIDELFSADSIWHGPSQPELRGPEARKQQFVSARGAFPDLQCTVDELVAEEDRVVVRWSATGTHQGEYWGAAPTGKRLSWSGTSTFRVAGGMITEEFIQFDALGFMQQLGVVPAIGQAKKLGL